MFSAPCGPDRFSDQGWLCCMPRWLSSWCRCCVFHVRCGLIDLMSASSGSCDDFDVGNSDAITLLLFTFATRDDRLISHSSRCLWWFGATKNDVYSKWMPLASLGVCNHVGPCSPRHMTQASLRHKVAEGLLFAQLFRAALCVITVLTDHCSPYPSPDQCHVLCPESRTVK